MSRQTVWQEGQSDTFSFYWLPKALIKDKKYEQISIEAKFVYGLFLDRLSLSQKNEWRDAQGQFFIIYTVQELKGDFGCSGKKIGRVLAELEQAELIVRKRQGLCKPNLIYIKPLMPEGQMREDTTSKNKVSKNDVSKNEEQKSEGTKGKFQKGQKETSGGDKKNILESAKGNTNKTDINNTENNKTETDLKEGEGDSASQNKKQTEENAKAKSLGIQHEGEESGRKESLTKENWQEEYFPEGLPGENWQENSTQEERLLRENSRRVMREEIARQLDYAMLQEEYPHEAENLRTIAEVLADTFSSKRQEIRVGGEEKPAEEVKEQLKQLNHRHIEYVLDCLRQNTSKVQNVFGYLLTVLYHAPLTIEMYYDRLVRHDMANRRR